MKSIVLFVLLFFSSSAIAQEDGVITIRKKDSENSMFKNVSIGIRTGPSFMSIGGKNVQEATRYMGNQTTNKLDVTYNQYRIYSSGGGSSPSGENTFDFPPTSINAAGYLIIPLHKRFSFVPEIAFRNMLAFSQAPDYDAYDTSPFGARYETKMRTQFRYAQIEMPMKVEAHFNWRVFDPYVKVGIGPVFNVYAKRIVKEEAAYTAPSWASYETREPMPEELRNVLEERGIEMHARRTSIKRANVSGVISLNMGFRFYLSKRTALCIDYQYMDAFGINAIATFNDGKTFQSNISTQSFSLALEYKLKGYK